ncbi:hypothetical protein ACIRQY_31690 [Streptomyces sp. NPDC101490]|uniref:hypothetical protein n=1 Tax=Streptomyces sp. NPDC101490 TaxID=3366143 RepID=UPI00382B426C
MNNTRRALAALVLSASALGAASGGAVAVEPRPAPAGGSLTAPTSTAAYAADIADALTGVFVDYGIALSPRALSYAMDEPVTDPTPASTTTPAPTAAAEAVTVSVSESAATSTAASAGASASASASSQSLRESLVRSPRFAAVFGPGLPPNVLDHNIRDFSTRLADYYGLSSTQADAIAQAVSSVAVPANARAGAR